MPLYLKPNGLRKIKNDVEFARNLQYCWGIIN